VAPLFYTTQPTTAPSPSPATNASRRSAAPDPWAAAAAIVHHHCDQDPATARDEDRGLALDEDQPPALHLLAGRWIASSSVCGFELASATSQARAERRSRHRTCPVCHQVA
jgi:hypothetical protein